MKRRAFFLGIGIAATMPAIALSKPAGVEVRDTVMRWAESEEEAQAIINGPNGRLIQARCCGAVFRLKAKALGLRFDESQVTLRFSVQHSPEPWRKWLPEKQWCAVCEASTRLV